MDKRFGKFNPHTMIGIRMIYLRIIINRPGVAGAVLQRPTSLIKGLELM